MFTIQSTFSNYGGFMHRVLAVVTVLLVGLAIVSTGTGQDKADKKVKGYTPPGWKGLELTADQKSKIGKIHDEYKGKITALENQIKELKTKERSEFVAVLTDTQKKALTKLALGDDGEPKADAKK